MRAPVDVAHLARLVIRRCDACDRDTHVDVATRFLRQQAFEPIVVEKVLVLLDEYLESGTLRLSDTEACVVNGSTVCAVCGARYYDHPEDPELEDAVTICDGTTVHLV